MEVVLIILEPLFMCGRANLVIANICRTFVSNVEETSSARVNRHLDGGQWGERTNPN